MENKNIGEIEKQNKNLAKRLEEAEKMISELNDKIEDLETDTDISESVRDSSIKGTVTDYEQKTETASRYNEYLLENETFGWEKMKEFHYKNGDIRFTMRRDKNNSKYLIWKENEKLYSILKLLNYTFYHIDYAIQNMELVTFKDIANDPEYKLSGLKKLFGIRTKEQKAEIKSKVKEANEAYTAFKKETEKVRNYIKKMVDDNVFLRDLDIDDDRIHKDENYIFSILERYKIKYENGRIFTDVDRIDYSFSTKRVELYSRSE